MIVVPPFACPAVRNRKAKVPLQHNRMWYRAANSVATPYDL